MLVPPIVSLLDRFQRTRLEKDWASMRALLHPEARLESLAAVGDVLSADRLIQVIEAASARRVYTVTGWEVELAQPRVGIASARVRYQVGSGAFTDEARVFVASELDGLIWRMRILHDRGSAERCFAEDGVDLGLSASEFR